MIFLDVDRPVDDLGIVQESLNIFHESCQFAVVSTHPSYVSAVSSNMNVLICQKSESKDTAQGTSTVESGTTSRIRFRGRKYNKQDYAEETDGTWTIKEGKEKQETTAHAMTSVRAFKNDGKYDHSEITINDDGLTASLLHALGLNHGSDT